eukprot:3810084-Rhodomonas_salina.2
MLQKRVQLALGKEAERQRGGGRGRKRREENLASALDDVERGGGGRVSKGVGKADDAAERRAELVRERGERLLLRAIRRCKLRLHLSELSDVVLVQDQRRAPAHRVQARHKHQPLPLGARLRQRALRRGRASARRA